MSRSFSPVTSTLRRRQGDSVARSIIWHILPYAPMLPVEDPRNEKLADYTRYRWELGRSRRDVQAAVNEVAEGFDFVLKVILDSGVHLLQFFNRWACSAHFGRIEVVHFCFQLRGDVNF